MSNAKDTADEGVDHKVYVHSRTHLCATKNLCIPCHYKVFPLGSFQSVGLPPNQRPEQCPRAKSGPYAGLYKPHHKILTLGDGDFSFSLSIARNVKFTTGCLIASSHESREQLLSTYNAVGIKDILKELEVKKITVLHCVDATNISLTSSIDENYFDAIIWNFPCVRVEGGADGQLKEIETNRRLLRDFFSNVHLFLLPLTGQLHITHKTIEPFSWWEIVKLAEECGFYHYCSLVFDRCLYPGYVNRKVLDKKSFPLHDARTFVFMKKTVFPLKSEEDEISEPKNLDIIPVVSTESTMSSEMSLISMTAIKTKKEFTISLNKILESPIIDYSKNLSRKFDKTADSSFSSSNKSSGVKKQKKKK